MSYLKKYEYVITIAKKGGISQAADALNVSQPTLSKYLKKLEAELGVELFDRSTLPIKLTAAGESYVEAGRQLIVRERQLQTRIQEIKLNRNSLIRIGISPSRSSYLMPAIIESYRKNDPDGRIIIKERTTAELNKLLSRGDLDLIINLLDEDSSQFERIPLFDEDILLAVPKSQFQMSKTAKEFLMTSTIINVGKGLILWHTMNKIVEKLELCKPEIECQSIESALALVKRGLGVMIVPSYVSQYGSEEQNKDISFLRLPIDIYSDGENGCRRKVCLFYRKEQFLTQAEKKFIACVKEEVSQEG